MNGFGIQRSPNSIFFGVGQRAALPEIAASLGKRAYICSDARFSADPQLKALGEQLRAKGLVVEVYEETIPELPLECVEDAAQRARAFGPDIIIGIGGGSCLDLAKLVALKLSHDGALSKFYGEFAVPGPIMPVIAVPTTSGTGSEVTPVAVVADPDRAIKVGISSPYLIPKIAVCDPELTLTCPASLTAIAGADALTHALEAFTALRRPSAGDIGLRHVFVGKNIISDAFATIAIQSITKYLVRAVEHGDDIEAREQVMLGALMAGQAFGVAGTAAAHAIQYPVGALTHTAHGLGVAALMPFVMEFNRSACPELFAEIGRMIGAAGTNDDDLGRNAIGKIEDIFRRIKIPASLAALGLPEDKISWVVEQSLLAQRLVKNNPRTLDSTAIHDIVTAAFAGERSRLQA